MLQLSWNGKVPAKHGRLSPQRSCMGQRVSWPSQDTRLAMMMSTLSTPMAQAQ